MTAPGTLSQQLRALLDEVEQGCVDGRPRAELADLRARLDEPLRIAVVGRIKAGKSTVVNALAGQAVAPTGAGECTRIVTWYRYGTVPRYTVVMRDGRRVERPLPDDGRLPERLDEPVADVARLEVDLSVATLRDKTLIDTPGLSSLDQASVAGTLATVGDPGTASALPRADALIWVFERDGIHSDERQLLHSIREQLQLRIIGLLSKADLGRGTEPLADARTLAARHAAELAGDAEPVISVVGLLAESCCCGVLQERDVAAVRQLAALPEAEVLRLLRTAERLTSYDGLDVPPPARARLVRVLGLYGIRLAVAAVRAGTTDLASVSAELLRVSRFAEVRSTIEAELAARTPSLKAAAVLAAMQRLADDPAGADPALQARLAAGAHALAGAPELAVLTLARTLHAHPVQLTPELDADVRALIDGRTVGARVGAADESEPAVREAVRSASRRWLSLRTTGSPRQAHLARLVLDEYMRVLDDLDGYA